MTLAEFKAWLEGFEHSFGEEGMGAPAQKVPSANQWAQVKEKLALVVLPTIVTSTPPPVKPHSDWYRTYVTGQNSQIDNHLDPKLAM